MQGNTGRRRTLTRNGVVAGSVWEARMRVDAVNGGIKVFTGDESRDAGDGNADEEGMRVYRRLRRNQSDSIAASRKRRIWTPPQSASPPTPSPSAVGGDGSPIQLRKSLSELPAAPRLLAASSQEVGGEKRLLAIGDGTEAAEGDDVEVEIGIEEGRGSFDDKEMDLPAEKGKSAEEEKTINQVHEIPVSSPIVEKDQNHSEVAVSPDAETKNKLIEKAIDPDLADPPAAKLGKKLNDAAILPSPDAEKWRINRRTLDRDPVVALPISGKKMNQIRFNPAVAPSSFSSVDGARKMFDRTSRQNNKMQSIVDLVMWRDVSKTAFVFGLGTFFLISSSYTKDLNFSFISAASHLGLIYLALVFFYKSILRRGETMDYDEGGERYMVGEEEAIWLLRLLLPYLNELLLKMRALFSGDPATTMKLAVLLFVMARCGSSITVWTLSRLTFFGVFTVPRICTSYSAQIARIGRFWLGRLRDGWESCTHKKAVAAAVFTLIWNISSTMARIWAVFMLVVALKFYQQCAAAEDWSVQEEAAEEVVVVEEVQEVSKTVQGRALGLQHRHRAGGSKREELAIRGERKIKKGA